MPRQWKPLGATVREGSFLLVLLAAGWLSCNHGPKPSPLEDAGAGGTQDAVGGDVPGTGGAIADASLEGTGGIDPCSYLPEPIDGADWLCGNVAVARDTMSCTISLPSAPPDVDNVAVYIDKQLVPQDSANGWAYGATTSVIDITGAYCEQLLTAQNTSVQVLFGCPGMHPPGCIP